MSCSVGDEHVGEPDPPEHGGVVVHLGGTAQQRDGAHEAGHQRQRHGGHAHVAAGQQKLLEALAVSVPDGVKNPDSG